MTPEQRQQVETQIQNDFAVLQKKLEDLKNEVQEESDVSKKQEKQLEFDKMKSELDKMKEQIDILSSLQEQALQALKTRLEQYSQVKQNVQ
jgi:peptidoglycan hydrolase CwlO-like protein